MRICSICFHVKLYTSSSEVVIQTCRAACVADLSKVSLWLFFCLLLLPQHYTVSRGWACFRLQENVQIFYCRNRVYGQCSDERLNWELIYILILLRNILSGFTFDSLEFESFIMSHREGSSGMATRWVFALRQSIPILSTWNCRDALWTLATVRLSILMIFYPIHRRCAIPWSRQMQCNGSRSREKFKLN